MINSDSYFNVCDAAYMKIECVRVCMYTVALTVSSVKNWKNRFFLALFCIKNEVRALLYVARS